MMSMCVSLCVCGWGGDGARESWMRVIPDQTRWVLAQYWDPTLRDSELPGPYCPPGDPLSPSEPTTTEDDDSRRDSSDLTGRKSPPRLLHPLNLINADASRRTEHSRGEGRNGAYGVGCVCVYVCIFRFQPLYTSNTIPKQWTQWTPLHFPVLFTAPLCPLHRKQ